MATTTFQRRTNVPLSHSNKSSMLSPATEIEKNEEATGKPMTLIPSKIDRPKAIPQTITDLIQVRASELDTADQPIVSYPSTGTTYTDYTPRQLDALAEKAAAQYASLIPRRRTSSDPVQVIALLGPSTFDYFVSLLALSRLGHTVLFLSTRLSDEAHISLLRGTRATTLLIDQTFRSVSERVQGQVPGLKIGAILSLDDELTTQKGGPDKQPEDENRLDSSKETHNVAWIIHSSGSTSLPKPIYITHAAALRNYKSAVSLVGFVTLPLYHAHGISCTFRGIALRKRIYLYNAALPLTSTHLLATLRGQPDIQIFYSVPYALKLLAESAEGLERLAKLEVVMFGGSACPKPIGDKLARAGVMLVGHYGSTETGQLMTSFRPREEILEWDWVRPSEELQRYLEWLPYDVEAGIYELVVLKGWPSLVTSNREDGGYATKDLFERHPEYPKKNAWRYYARRDDTIVLVNGEKSNPLLLEGAARQSPLVTEAIVFGAQRSSLGMFVLPAQPDLTREEVSDAVWPAIQEANQVVPAYGRLSKDMIRLLPPNAESTIRKTDKGTIIRAAFYKAFAGQIDAIYEEAMPKGSLILDKDELRIYLRQQLEKILDLDRVALLRDDTDLFSLGVDSLQASQIRSIVLRNIDVGANSLGQNFVFDFPSIDSMATELVGLRTGQRTDKKRSIEERMQAMIEKYSVFEQHRPVSTSTPGECVLVTGVTGSLGAHLVAQLSAMKEVRKVYCLVRAKSDADAVERMKKSLEERQVEIKSEKVTVYASQLGDKHLGLEPGVYKGLKANLTNVIHCAWSVNFNLGLESFENDCIKGTKHLIDLCQRTETPKPASFNFCSSVSAVADSPGPDIPEALPRSLAYAQKMGYAQSKLVTENICLNAARSTGLTARVLRTGQVIGDTQHGIWNAQEAIPMMFRSAVTIGALPQLDERPSWLPVDTVAAGLRELSLSPTCQSGVFHVVNDKTFHWTKDLLPMLEDAGLDFEGVDRREWVRRLRSVPDPVVNPPFKLVEFFAEKYDKESGRKGVCYMSDKAREGSQSLQDSAVLDADLVKKIVQRFESVWTQ